MLHSILFSTLLYWSCLLKAEDVPCWFPPSPPPLVLCSGQHNQQQENKLQTTCLWHRNSELCCLRVPGAVSNIWRKQTVWLALPHWFRNTVLVHRTCCPSGWLVLSSNFAKGLEPSLWNSSYLTIQCGSPSHRAPIGFHHNLNIEVGVQDVQLSLHWSRTLPIHEWQPVQLGWFPPYSSRDGSQVAFLPNRYYPDAPLSTQYCDGERHQMCTSSFKCQLTVHCTHQGLYIASLGIKNGLWVRFGVDLQVEPTLIHILSAHSRLLNTLHRTIHLSWNLLSVSSKKLIYRLSDIEGRGVWSTFYNPYALQHNYSVVQIPHLSRKKVVAKISFSTDNAWHGKLSGGIMYSNATLKLSLEHEPPAYFTLNIQKIKTGIYLFSNAHGFYYSTQEGDANSSDGSSMHHIYYQHQSLFYLITIKLVHLHWYRFHVHLYLNQKGALLRSSEKDIEVHLFNSGSSFFPDSTYVVWFIPLQHPLLKHKWIFSLQLFDWRKENLLWSNTYTCKDQVQNAAHFIPHSVLPFNPALYTGFVAQVRCARGRRAHAILNATINHYASKVIGSTVNCLQRICFITKVKIQTPNISDGILYYNPKASFVLTAKTQVNCPHPKVRNTFTWNIYKVPDVKTSPDWSKPLNPPSVRIRNLITLKIPSFSLNDGLYLFNFTVKHITIVGLERVEGSDSVFVQIGSNRLIAAIAGGKFRSVGFSHEWTLHGSASSDRDVVLPSEGLTFTWYCTKPETDDVSITDMSPGTEKAPNGKCHPDQVDQKWMRPSDPIQTVPPGTLPGNAVYYFRLVVEKGHQIAQAHQMVHILPGPLPMLNITCIENCGTQIIPTKMFCLFGKCLNCREFSRPAYHWSIFSTGSTEINLDWESKTTTGRSNSYICINPLSFVNRTEKSYMLVLKVSTRGDQSSVHSYLFSINSPPQFGKCFLSPTTGMALLTKFVVHCSGFKDKHLPLMYKIKTASDTLSTNQKTSMGFSTLGTTVYFGYASKSAAFFLPVGVSSKQYVLPVHVEVYDALGAHTLVILQAIVFGPIKGNVTLKKLQDLTNGSSAPETSFLENADYFGVSYFVYMLASALNDIDPLPRLHSFKTELREILLMRSSEIPTTGIIDIHQIISSISQTTKKIMELSSTSQLVAAAKLKEVIERLSTFTRKDVGSKEIEVLGSGILEGLSNVLRASLLDPKNIDVNRVKDTISITEILADLVLQYKVPGENETIMEAKDWTITLWKNKNLESSDAFVRRKYCKNFFYPHLNQEDKEGLPVDAEISTILYEFDNTPFPWLPNSNDIGTTVTGFKIVGLKSNGDRIGIRPDRVEIIMFPKKEDLPIFGWMIRPARKLPKIVGRFSFEVHRNSKDIFIQIVTKLKLTFQIFVHRGLKFSPSLIASFQVSFNKPSNSRRHNSSDEDCTSQVPYIFCLSHTLLKSIFRGFGAEKQNISVVLQANLRVETSQLIKIVLFTADCLYLDGIESHWEENLCTSGPQTSWEKLHCVCTGKTRFSRSANSPSRISSEDYVRFVAGRKTVHVRAVSTKGFASTQTHRNPITTLTTVAIFVAYIVLAVWAIKKDRADQQSRDHVIVLPDNDPFDKVCYLVTIYTGSRLGSGSTADIFIQLMGQSGVSDMHCLRHTKYTTFGRGAIDTFLLTSKNDLGEIRSIRVWHNNDGFSPNWFLSRVKVENVYTKQTWMFICQKWLALEKDDSQIERTFSVTPPDEPLTKMNFFLISFAADMSQSHLWLSVFASVCSGPLNRLQRLSCCLVILLCILFFNTLFFNAEKAEHLSYLRPVVIGIQSAFIAIPLQMILTAFFKYSRMAPSLQNTTRPEGCTAFISGKLWNWKECLQKWYVAETASKVSDKLKPLDRRRWTETLPSWMNCTISEGTANKIAAEEIATEEDPQQESKISPNSLKKDMHPQVKPADISIMLLCKGSQTKASVWCMYTSWVLVLVVSAIASFYIILYGLSYNYKTSLEWLTASTIAFCGNVFLLETLNIAFFSALKALFPKYCDHIPWTGNQPYLEIKLEDEATDADEMRELHYDLVQIRSTKNYQPLEEDEITIYKKRLKVQHNAFVFLKDLLCHIIFLIFILNIGYSIENTNNFYYNKNIYHKLSPGLWEVGKIEHVYVWLRNVFLPLIHNDYSPTYLSDSWSKILGLPRIRQIRAENVTKECFYPHSFVNKFVISKSNCLHRYGDDPEEKRDHLESWKHPINKSTDNNFSHFSGFIYQSNSDQWTYDSYGELNTYGTGGYTFYFNPEDDLPTSLRKIETLEKKNWLDENTWALIVELTSFNPDVELFCSISIVFETSYLGSINTSLSIHSYILPLFNQLSSTQKLIYVTVAYMLFFYIIDEIFVIHQQRLKYVKEVSNLINFGIKVVCLIFLGQLAFKFDLTSRLIQFYLHHPNQFIPFHKVCQVDQVLQVILSFLAFLVVLKTLRYSRFFYDVRLAQRSIYAALPGICSMALVVAVYFFVYMAFGYLVFGQHEWNYNTMTHSAQTVFSYCVSAFKDTAFTSNRVLGGLYLATFMMVMICVLINLFQAVIMSAYEDMKQPVYEEPSEEAEVVSFLVHKIRRIWFYVTCRRPTPAHDADLFNRVLFGHPQSRNPHHLGLKSRKINGRKMVYLVI